jgi:hypothetical protein
MQEACAGDRPGLTKHQAVIGALGRVARTAEKSDMVELWEFDDAPTFVGSTRVGEKRQADLGTLVRALSGPRGGTEIGGSLDRVLTGSKARDVLLITDGKSHALDVQALAQRGRRISTVLVGEDSLEANVGHLAALTGGEIFVAAGADLATALEGAARSLKIPHQAPAPIDGAPQRVAVRRGGMSILARWQPTDTTTGDALTLRAVAAMAASLALPAMATESAAMQVMAAAAMMPGAFASPARRGALQAGALAKEPARSSGLLSRLRSFVDIDGRSDDEAPAASKRQRDRFDGGGLADTIGWDQAPHRLQAGDLTDLDPTVARAIRDLAARTEVIAVAKKLALDPVVLVIGLLARIVADRNRSATRIARAIFGKRPRREVDEAAATARIE